jgi:hypothetical protein
VSAWTRILIPKTYADRQRRAGFLFVLPAVIFFSCVFLVPLDPLFGSVVIPQPLPVVNADSYESIVLEITGSRPPPSR